MLRTSPESVIESEVRRRSDVVPAARRPRGVYLLDPASFELIYGPEERRKLAELADIHAICLTKDDWAGSPEVMSDVEYVFSGWGAPCMDADFLRSAPRLKAVFYGAGSVRPLVTEAFWARGIVITSAYAANAVPVAEYTVGTILLSLRQFWSRSASAKQGEGWGDHTRPIPGSYRATVGLISFGMIARKVAEFLRHFDLKVIVYCPYLSAAEAHALGVERVSLEEVFTRSDVVSVHSPVLTETIGLVNGDRVAAMKNGATLINTARGRILAQTEVIAVLRARPDLHAVLDVTDPEPPQAGDPLLALPNVTVTSHIAGSHGRDCFRMGHYMVEECKNHLAGRPLRWQITREMTEKMA